MLATIDDRAHRRPVKYGPASARLNVYVSEPGVVNSRVIGAQVDVVRLERSWLQGTRDQIASSRSLAMFALIHPMHP